MMHTVINLAGAIMCADEANLKDMLVFLRRV